MSDQTSSIDDQLAAFFASYSQAWRANDSQRIAEHWDAAHFQFYKAEEIGAFFHSWDEVSGYWTHNESFHDAVDLKFSEFRPMPLGSDWMMCVMRMRWDILFSKTAKLMDGSAFEHQGTAMGGDDHVLTLLRVHDGTVKLCGWSETPDAPITYIANLYKNNLSPGFPK